jgi:hypothetical protein
MGYLFFQLLLVEREAIHKRCPELGAAGLQ